MILYDIRQRASAPSRRHETDGAHLSESRQKDPMSAAACGDEGATRSRQRETNVGVPEAAPLMRLQL